MEPRSSKVATVGRAVSPKPPSQQGPTQSRLSTQLAGSGWVLGAPGIGLLVVEWMSAQVLSVADIGTIQQWLIPIQSIVSLVLLGVPVTLGWWASQAVGRQTQPPVLPAVFLALAVGAVAAMGVFFVPSPWPLTPVRLSPAEWVLFGASLAGILAVAAIWEPIVIALGGHRWSVGVASVSLAVMVAVAFVFLLLPQPGPLLAIPAALLSNGFVRALGSAWGLSRMIVPGRVMERPDGLLSFALLTAVLAVMDATSTWADRIIVSAWADDPAQLALYRYGARELPLLAAVTGALALVLRSRLTAGRSASLHQSGNETHAAERHRWKTSSGTLLLALVPLGTWLGVYAPELFSWVYGPDWSSASVYFRIYLVLLVARALPLLSLLQAEGFKTVILVGAIIDVLIAAGLGSILVLGWNYGPQAAAWCYVGGTLLQTVIYAAAAQRRLGAILPWRALGGSVAGGAAVLGICLVFPLHGHAALAFGIHGLGTMIIIRLLIAGFLPPPVIHESSE